MLIFHRGEILKAISQLKTNRSGGPDHIINEFIVHGKHICANNVQFI